MDGDLAACAQGLAHNDIDLNDDVFLGIILGFNVSARRAASKVSLMNKVTSLKNRNQSDGASITIQNSYRDSEILLLWRRFRDEYDKIGGGRTKVADYIYDIICNTLEQQDIYYPNGMKFNPPDGGFRAETIRGFYKKGLMLSGIEFRLSKVSSPMLAYIHIFLWRRGAAPNCFIKRHDTELAQNIVEGLRDNHQTFLPHPAFYSAFRIFGRRDLQRPPQLSRRHQVPKGGKPTYARLSNGGLIEAAPTPDITENFLGILLLSEHEMGATTAPYVFIDRSIWNLFFVEGGEHQPGIFNDRGYHSVGRYICAVEEKIDFVEGRLVINNQSCVVGMAYQEIQRENPSHMYLRYGRSELEKIVKYNKKNYENENKPFSARMPGYEGPIWLEEAMDYERKALLAILESSNI